MAFQETFVTSPFLQATPGGSSGGSRRRAVIDIVDNTLAPPTETLGDRYILDTTPGGVNSNWDGASANDIVEFDGSVWTRVTPEEGWVTFVDLQDTDYIFIDDGIPQWEIVTSSNVDGGTY